MAGATSHIRIPTRCYVNLKGVCHKNQVEELKRVKLSLSLLHKMFYCFLLEYLISSRKKKKLSYGLRSPYAVYCQHQKCLN